MNRVVDKFVQNVFFGTISFIAAFGVYFLKDLAKEVSDLNGKMAVVLQTMSYSDSVQRDHESRIRALEGK